MAEPLSLQQARKTILSHVQPLPHETVILSEGLNRIPSKSLKALQPVPHFRQATMDGYAVHSSDIPAGSKTLPVAGEIAAGRTDVRALPAGQAIRIMTGGRVPPGADQVIPYELCQESENQITISCKPKRWSNIRKEGADLKKGQVIARRGCRITPLHLQLLATSGHTVLPVVKQPRVAFLCTGSELVDAGPLPGQIISGNRALLAGLIKKSYSLPVDLGTADDDEKIIAQKIAAAGAVQVIITTGGMGPGKYDLIRQVCSRNGIQTLYRSLNVRPGRATLFGRKGNVLFFGLPGPPPAAFLLFEELVRPALLALQGVKHPTPTEIKAVLQEAITVNKRGLLNLKNASLYTRGGKLFIRPQYNISTPPNASICIPAHRRRLRKGELVTVHSYAEHFLAE